MIHVMPIDPTLVTFHKIGCQLQGCTGCASWVTAPNSRPEVELCHCGQPARFPDPHNDGDCPMEFCADCLATEERRLRDIEERGKSLREMRMASARAQLNAELPKEWKGRKR